LTVAALSAAVLFTACEDKRVKQLDTGITRDSAVSVISHDLPAGAGPDSFPNVYKKDRYLINGTTYEVLYFTPDNKKAPVVNSKPTADTIPLRKLTPLVFRENRLMGRGWTFWDSVATSLKIPVPPKE
jgi:hypothetical protein